MMKRLFGSLMVLALVLTLIAGNALAGQVTPASPGDLDLTFAGFSGDGTAITFGSPMPSAFERRGMALQTDGKIVVVGFTGISLLVMRYLPNGALDGSFDFDGIATPINPAYAMRGTSVAIQADGKIVVAGWADTNPSSFLLARLTTTGALDTSFGGNGYVITSFSYGTDEAYAVVVQPDGKIIAAGRALIGGDYDFAVARYDTHGSLDRTYSDDGIATIGFGGDEACLDIALDEFGRLVMVGQDDDLGGLSDNDFEVARLDVDGTLDDSFDEDGKLTTGFGARGDGATAVAIQSDGKIVVAGDDTFGIGTTVLEEDALVARYWADGTLDDSFAGDGKLSIESLTGGITDVALQTDGKIILMGFHQSPDDDYKFALYRLDQGGALDSSFDDDGSAFIDLNSVDIGHSLSLQPDGRIIGYGGTGSDHALVRLWPDGSFDAGGQQALGFADPVFGLGSGETAFAMAIQPDFKIVLAGEVVNTGASESEVALARFLPDGQLDTSFGEQGRVWFGFGQYDLARSVAIQPDGKIVVAGTSDPFGGVQPNFLVARFNPDGSLDDTFGFFGFNIVDFLGTPDYGQALALTPDGKIVVAGEVYNGTRWVYGVARLNTDGTLDSSFNGTGMQLFEWVQSNWANAVVVQTDGKIVVGGHVDGDFALVRFNQDGPVDVTFGSLGATLTDMGGEDIMYALTLRPGDSLVAAGSRSIGGMDDFALAQYTSNGVLASGPGVWLGGKAFVDWGGSDTAFAVDVRSDGQILGAGCADGQFAWAQLSPRSNLSPLKATTDFAGTGGECAYGVKFTGSNKIIAAGVQISNGNENMALARFETTIGPDPNPTPGPGDSRIFLPLILR